MSSSAAPRCRHIKVNGTQCGSPALHNKDFCFYHTQTRPTLAECYYKPDEYSTGEIALPIFEDAHSIQNVIRQIVQMVLQKRLERKTASTLLYALQIASSNLKRMELEKPQPEQVVTDLETDTKSDTPMAALSQTSESPASEQPPAEVTKRDDDKDESLPPGTIQACYQPYRPIRSLHREIASCGDGAPPRSVGRGTATTQGRRKRPLIPSSARR